MAQQLLRADLANATKPSLDDYDKDRVMRVAAEAYVQAVAAWELADSDAEKMLAVDHQTWMQIKNKTWSGSFNQEQLDRIGLVIGLYDTLHSCFGEERADRWVTAPNRLPMFHGRKPIDAMIEEGLPMMKKARCYADELLGGM